MDLTGDSEEERLKLAIQRILYDASTDEGRTREHFLKNQFPDIERNPLSMGPLVRQFIDGLFEFMLEKRKDAFAPLMVDIKVSDDSTASINKPRQRTLEDILMLCVEDAVIRPVYQRIVACVRKIYDKDKNRKFVERAEVREDPGAWDVGCEMRGVFVGVYMCDGGRTSDRIWIWGERWLFLFSLLCFFSLLCMFLSFLSHSFTHTYTHTHTLPPLPPLSLSLCPSPLLLLLLSCCFEGVEGQGAVVFPRPRGSHVQL